MAIVKHIKSRNANYSAAINYLLFEHDEKTGEKIVDESGRSILRKEFYMDGLNCDPMSFDKECELTNAHFHKNKKREDIKSHHYIISYDPADVTDITLHMISSSFNFPMILFSIILAVPVFPVSSLPVYKNLENICVAAHW